MILRQVLAALLLLLLLLLPAGLATAAPPAMDAATLGAFLDDFFAREMSAQNVLGAAVSVVKDGQVLLTRGYGYADLEAKRPVDPAATVFKVASLSKLPTATAVMQQVAEGKLGLPPRLTEPGEFFTYSNQGMTLAGHAVERVSGLTFADYMVQRVFGPLGMTRSTASASLWP